MRPRFLRVPTLKRTSIYFYLSESSLPIAATMAAVGLSTRAWVTLKPK